MSDAVPQAFDADPTERNEPPPVKIGLPKAPITITPDPIVAQPALNPPDPLLFAAVIGFSAADEAHAA